MIKGSMDMEMYGVLPAEIETIFLFKSRGVCGRWCREDEGKGKGKEWDDEGSTDVDVDVDTDVDTDIHMYDRRRLHVDNPTYPILSLSIYLYILHSIVACKYNVMLCLRSH